MIWKLGRQSANCTGRCTIERFVWRERNSHVSQSCIIPSTSYISLPWFQRIFLHCRPRYILLGIFLQKLIYLPSWSPVRQFVAISFLLGAGWTYWYGAAGGVPLPASCSREEDSKSESKNVKPQKLRIRLAGETEKISTGDHQPHQDGKKVNSILSRLRTQTPAGDKNKKNNHKTDLFLLRQS